MGWMVKLNTVAKTGAASAIDAIGAGNCLGDVAGDSNFSAHLAAAQAAAVAAVAGLTGSATMVDVAIACEPDTSAAETATYDSGTAISINVTERY